MNEILNRTLNTKWEGSTYKMYKPRILLGMYDNKLYATVSDNTTIYRFVSFPEAGKKAIIYAVVASKCKPYNSTYGLIWLISDTQQDQDLNKPALQVISCPSEDSNVNTWVISGTPIGFNYDKNFDHWVKNTLGVKI